MQEAAVNYILGQTLILAAIGIAGGLVTAVAVTRFAAELLYGVSPADPAASALISALLLAVVSWRATSRPAA